MTLLILTRKSPLSSSNAIANGVINSSGILNLEIDWVNVKVFTQKDFKFNEF